MMDFTGWKYYTNLRTNENLGIVSPDGNQARLLIDPEVAEWIASGGTPLPAENE
jgi:hypothetical protein